MVGGKVEMHYYRPLSPRTQNNSFPRCEEKVGKRDLHSGTICQQQGHQGLHKRSSEHGLAPPPPNLHLTEHWLGQEGPRIPSGPSLPSNWPSEARGLGQPLPQIIGCKQRSLGGSPWQP
jgi:hypothetical protein